MIELQRQDLKSGSGVVDLIQNVETGFDRPTIETEIERLRESVVAHLKKKKKKRKAGIKLTYLLKRL